MPLPVLTKHDFVRRYERGEFGNRAPTWPNLQAWQRSGYRGLIHLRSRIAGGATYYNVPSARLPALWRRVAAAQPRQWYLSAMAPTLHTTLQGEAQRAPDGIHLYHSLLALPMRQALAEQPRTANGIMSVALLKQHLCPNSYDWLAYLLDNYEEHIVEFSTYSINWGTLPNYNTVFWEVRRY